MTAEQQTLALPAVGDPTPAPATLPIAPDVRKRLWLCVWLPRLSLETLYRRDATACAVFEEQN